MSGGSGWVCPTPVGRYESVVMGHGSGGRLSARLLSEVILPALCPNVGALEDQATVSVAELSRIAITTDSFVVDPIFFPGGDLGSLAVNGTVNDLAVGGARPHVLSAAFILEEGLPLTELERVAESMREACAAASVRVVTGDTKVVQKGKGDRLFITTTGIGIVPDGRQLSVEDARPGDRVIVSGTLGDHGIAIMSVREGLSFETALESDCRPLWDLCHLMLETCPEIRFMRDPTRGGLSSVLNELAAGSKVGVRLDESALPLRDGVRGACELLGLDPLYVANEGKVVAVVPAADAEELVAVMRMHPDGRDATCIGEIVDAHPGMVTMTTTIGGERVVAMLSGEQLPRIC